MTFACISFSATRRAGACTGGFTGNGRQPNFDSFSTYRRDSRPPTTKLPSSPLNPSPTWMGSSAARAAWMVAPGTPSPVARSTTLPRMVCITGRRNVRRLPPLLSRRSAGILSAMAVAWSGWLTRTEYAQGPLRSGMRKPPSLPLTSSTSGTRPGQAPHDSQTRTLAPVIRFPTSSTTRPASTTSGRSAARRLNSARRNSMSESTRQVLPFHQGNAHDGVHSEQNSTQLSSSAGSQISGRD